MNDPSSAEGFTVIFNKARNEKKGGGKSDSPGKDEPGYNKNGQVLGKPTVSSLTHHLLFFLFFFFFSESSENFGLM